jgi:O-antigen/teichoic acid export membrane protein
MAVIIRHPLIGATIATIATIAAFAFLFFAFEAYRNRMRNGFVAMYMIMALNIALDVWQMVLGWCLQ